MAEVNPLFLNIDNVYGSDELTLPYRDIIGEGVVDAGDLLVAQNGTPNMSVNIAEDAAWVRGDHDVNRQPTYRCYNDATKNLSIAAADATNPRKDIVIAEVLDDIFSGASKLWRLRVITGTPAGAPAEPALPNSAHKLAVVTVGAAVSSILNADIVDTRVLAAVGGGAASAGRIAYAERTFSLTVSATSEATALEVLTSGLRYYDGAEIEIAFTAPRILPGAAGTVACNLWDGATNLGWLTITQPEGGPAYGFRSLVPTPGLHEFRILAYRTTANGTIGAGIGGAGVFLPVTLLIKRA